MGAGQPAGVLPKPQLFLPTLIGMGQDLVSVRTALVWVPVTTGSDVTGVSFRLPCGALKGVLGRPLAAIRSGHGFHDPQTLHHTTSGCASSEDQL